MSDDTTILWEVARSTILDHINGVGELDKFTSWAVITATMFVGNANYIPEELEFIRHVRPEWIKPALEHPLCFGEVPSDIMPNTAGNSIHQLYHLTKWSTQAKDTRMDKMNSILEIGGGYGELARIIHALGFKGSYTIFDLPEVHKLQHLYLSKHLPMDSQVIYEQDPAGLAPYYDLIIGCFSLSEMPVELRDRIMFAASARSIMFVFQPEFYGIDNDAYFHSMAFELEHSYTSIENNPVLTTNWRYFYANP